MTTLLDANNWLGVIVEGIPLAYYRVNLDFILVKNIFNDLDECMSIRFADGITPDA